jgi:hypothetical protein
MKEKNINRYPEISSFKDFHLERERLLLKSKLIETRIDLEVYYIRRAFSISNLFFSFVKKYLQPRI